MTSFMTTCFVILTTFTITIAICLQLFLMLNNWTISHLVYEALISYSIYRARSYQLPTSDNIKHTQCLSPFTNKTISCELLGYNILFSNIIPNWDKTATTAPETFIHKVRNEYVNDLRYSPPFGTVYEYITIAHLKSLLIHSDTLNRGSHKKIFSKGCIVYFHGGGFVMGSTFPNHKFLSYLHLFSGIPVLGVDYKLAPEYPLYDVWFLDDADHIIIDYLYNKMRIDYNNIYVIGESAGGGIALSVIQYFSTKDINIGGGIFISATVNWTYNEPCENDKYDIMLSPFSRYLFKVYQYQCRNNNGSYVNGGIDYNNTDECIALGNEKLEQRKLNPISNDWSKMKGYNMLFIASQYELLMNHSVWGHNKAITNGANSVLHIIPNSSLHILPVFVDIPEAMKCVSYMSQVIKQWNMPSTKQQQLNCVQPSDNNK